VYGGARKSSPTEPEIQKILSGGTLQTITYEEKKEYVAPKAALRPKGQAASGQSGPPGRPPQKPATPPKPTAAPTTAPVEPTPVEPTPVEPTPVESEPPPEEAPYDQAAPTSLWAVAQHPETGQEYYYHTETNEVTWEKPAELA